MQSNTVFLSNTDCDGIATLHNLGNLLDTVSQCGLVTCYGQSHITPSTFISPELPLRYSGKHLDDVSYIRVYILSALRFMALKRSAALGDLPSL